jgi:hypothetical protein
MLCLRTSRVPPHELLHKIRRHTTRIPHHILGDLQRLRQHILRSLNKPSQILSLARYVAPVVIACIARLCPTSLGRKNELQASIMSPRRANTNPIFAFLYAMRMFMGSVIVMPMPTAEPWRAPMVGLRQWNMERVTRPPLCDVSMCLVFTECESWRTRPGDPAPSPHLRHMCLRRIHCPLSLLLRRRCDHHR